MALVDFTKPLLLNEEPAFNVGHGTWIGGIVYYISTGIPPVIYPYNDLGTPIDDPYFIGQGYPVGTYLLENDTSECAQQCGACIEDPENQQPEDLVKDLYVVQWDNTFSLMSLEDMRFGFDVIKYLPQSIVHLRLTREVKDGPVTEITTSELLNTQETIENFYALGEIPPLPDSYYYDDSAIWG